MNRKFRSIPQAYAAGRAEGESAGVREGLQVFALLAMIAEENVRDGYLEEAAYRGIFAAWERETERILLEEFKGDIEELTESVLGHTEELRRKYGLPV